MRFFDPSSERPRQSRRRLLRHLTGGFLATAFAPLPALALSPSIAPDERNHEGRHALLAGYRRTLTTMAKAGVLPIIDIEHHWGTGKGVAAFPVEDLLARMDRNGVALTWLGVNESMGSRASLTECAKAPERLVPTLMHGDGPRWHGRDATLHGELETEARSGEYFAMGEFEARHYISSTNSRDIHTPINSAGFEALFRVATDTGLPFLLHHEAEDALLPELEEMLTRFPKAPLIWCHVGRNRNPARWTRFPSPDGVRDFIGRYPNLYFDLLQSGSQSRFPPNSGIAGVYDAVMYFQDTGPARLRPQWLALFADHPERFLIGSDVNRGRWPEYDQVFDRLRGAVLTRLSPGASELIAYRNAWKLMAGKPWAD